MPAIGAGGRRSVSRHTFLAFLGDPPQRLCKGFKGGKQDSPLCALFTSFLWRQRKDVPPRHERFRKTKRFYRKYGFVKVGEVQGTGGVPLDLLEKYIGFDTDGTR